MPGSGSAAFWLGLVRLYGFWYLGSGGKWTCSTLPQHIFAVSLGTLLLYVLITTAVAVLLTPIAWMISTAFKGASEVFAVPPTWFPKEPTLEGFAEAFRGPLMRFFLNSLAVAVGTTALATFTGALTAYALSRIPFPGSSGVLLFFLAAMAFPLPLLMISMYMMFSAMGLLNSYPALILSHTVITLPICVWLLKSFFDTLPVDMEEARLYRRRWTLLYPVAHRAADGQAGSGCCCDLLVCNLPE